MVLAVLFDLSAESQATGAQNLGSAEYVTAADDAEDSQAVPLAAPLADPPSGFESTGPGAHFVQLNGIVLYDGSHLRVTQLLTRVVVENRSSGPLAIRVAWDGCDPDAMGGPPGCDSEIDNSVGPGEHVARPIKNHYTIQSWAWGTDGGLVDSCDLQVVPPSPDLRYPPVKPPLRLAFYYGYPSLVNDCGGDPECATGEFAQFDLVVFADALVRGSHEDYTRTITIVNNLESGDTDVYGYVDMALEVAEVITYVDLWEPISVTGIFLDRAGRDFGVTITDFITVVDYIHSLDLLAFANAWDPDDVFTPTTPLLPGDWYLAESHPVSGDLCTNLDAWWTKSQKAAHYRDKFGVRVATVSTGDDRPCDDWPDRPSYRAALWATYLFGFDAFAFTNPLYSASGPSTNYLCPLPPLPTNVGIAYLGPPTGPVSIDSLAAYERLTDKGTIYVYDTCDGVFVNQSLAVSKTAEPSPVQDGSPLTYTLRVTNTSMAALTATVTDILPSQVSPSDVLVWEASIPPASAWEEQVVVTVQTGYTGPLVNKVKVTSEEGTSSSESNVVCANVCKFYLPLILKFYPLIVEAEDCYEDPGPLCRTEGCWIKWCKPEFSGGCLISNEGCSEPSHLFVNSKGFRFCVVYRQDHWYGVLDVEIDGTSYDLDQRGPEKNQAEVCYEVDSAGSHSLVLTAEPKPNVVTVDAIRVFR
jgi:uncharacterized repeat protein (TIGR01451 family)